MRTTVTLDKDVERMLREAMHRSRTSLKKTLNAAIRAGLGPKGPVRKSPAYVIRPKAMLLKAGLDPAALNKLADDLEVEAFLEKNRGSRNS